MADFILGPFPIVGVTKKRMVFFPRLAVMYHEASNLHLIPKKDLRLKLSVGAGQPDGPLQRLLVKFDRKAMGRRDRGERAIGHDLTQPEQDPITGINTRTDH